MHELDYSTFSRFCHCAFHGLSDILSPHYLLGKHCYKMSYDEMRKFYRRFKKTAMYIDNLDDFIYHLKWFDEGPDSDLTQAVVLDDVCSCNQILKEDCVAELYSRYNADIKTLVCELKEADLLYRTSLLTRVDQDDDLLPF